MSERETNSEARLGIDPAVLQRFIAGEAEALSFLYKVLHQRIYRFCARLTGSSEMAKDILQESFLKAWDNRHLFRGDNFQAWLYTIAHRVCLNHLRSRKNKPTSSYEEGIHAQLHSTRRLEESDFVLRRTIEKAVSDLPLEFREAIILRDYEEYSYKEIADILQIDLSLAKVRVHRARLILRKVLAPMIQESHES